MEEGGKGVENLRQMTQVGDKTDLWVTPKASPLASPPGKNCSPLIPAG